MNKEIERKFLVKNNKYKSKKFFKIKQGYFADGVRVRTMEGKNTKKGFITFKTPKEGISRDEYEYEIPYSDAVKILNDICISPIIEKIRYIKKYKKSKWETDVFLGDNKGLIISEIEMDREDYEFEKPKWIDIEVTQEKKYYNSYLTLNPYKNW